MMRVSPWPFRMPPRTWGALEFLVILEKLIECLEDKAQVLIKLAVIIYHSKEGSQLVEGCATEVFLVSFF